MDKYLLFIYINLLLIICIVCKVGASTDTVDDYTTEPVMAIEETTTIMEETENTYLGKFKLTAYCPCTKCCGKSDGITASGTRATANRTIAVDPKVIPIGSQVMIGDTTYVAEDIGGAVKGNIIDVYFDSHTEALNFGIQYKDVSIVG